MPFDCIIAARCFLFRVKHCDMDTSTIAYESIRCGCRFSGED
jgi:hypothetical protein